ncbi:hypothetical protein CFAM422_000776 [Trichoderma lentiforme]|uniref:Uncharacterized protein n=1 Tax=Trichoderma lentiforme TaxID=1567552 RepID=A0A9P4XRP8_9HYPO|nr:hypothetical protein CFAM422_000776 [Trichoderma lentiforme]
MQEPVPVSPPLLSLSLFEERCPRRQRRLLAPNGDDQQSLVDGDGSNEANPSSPRRWNRFPSTGDLVRGEN